MKRYIFGLDGKNPAEAARRIKKSGCDSVVISVGDFEGQAAAKSAGLETWLCFGAHAMGDFDAATHGAIDAKGNPAPWFGSACPNSAEVNARNLDAAFASAAKMDGLTGIFVDGARFASFASEEGAASFFGCFCPRCMDKMRAMGLDADMIKSGIAMLMDHAEGVTGDIPTMRQAIDGWFDFRAACVKEYMEAFAQRAHAANLKSAAFVFAPSLWWFVGQRPDSLSALDVVAPMLYRAYPHETGTACLSHEWAAFKELLSHTDRKDPSGEASLLFDMAFISDDPMAGFAPEHVGLEVAAAKAQLRKGTFLAPIVQTEDDQLETTVACALSSGADACGEFMYSQKTFA